ncbi:uncharacterized protein TM35_000072000 [Trypanosoma theileri]|uniref:Uncharacterized protein n=1 Tax=Trypanosoma theileri TaxID=67003 RepID=A0A1X0P1F2_9TRYP|nr:uncharacterized protein TM35_000072000 [Trypanosoma theileri]ORC90776.1 hypothetical protein TM35_000072000 [Trypanosoma theileri]
MVICPGLCGDLAVTPFRVFLGTLPSLAVEERFLRQLQPVYAWYGSRRRVKEQASEFLEIDLASCDLELLLRYSHVYYVRRELHAAAVERQFGLLDGGRAAVVAPPALLECLRAGNAAAAPRHRHEAQRLRAVKAATGGPGRRELDPAAPLEPHDYACMMRLAEEDAAGGPEAEMQARAFLPRDLVEAKAKDLTQRMMAADARSTLDKKEAKLFNRIIPNDYVRVGSVEKMRPCDVTAYFRFYGERISKVNTENYFKRALWGHIYRKFATHPSFLKDISMYWARHTGLDPNSLETTMPQELAVSVCKQQNLFPATKFRSQYLYTSPELARQSWRSDVVIPLLRLFPLMGARAAEDLAASVLVDSFWADLSLGEEDNLLKDTLIRTVRHFVDEVGNMYEVNTDAVLKRVEEGYKIAVPNLTSEELHVENAEGDDKKKVVEDAAA